MTYQQMNQKIRLTLEENAIDDGLFEAQELLSFTANLSKTQLFRDYKENCPQETQEKTNSLLEKRLTGTPLPHLLGQWDFYGLTFHVNENTLIPRLDTEVLIDKALSLPLPKENMKILDLCSGTGCIGITLGKKLPHAQVILGEISPKALEICEKNIQKHKLENSVTAMTLDALAPPPITGFHLLASNPPYITKEEMAQLPPDVSDFEPHLALYGGNDGLDFYRAILKHWTKAILPNGYLLFEVGFAQGEDVGKMMRDFGLIDVTIYRDTNDKNRVIQGQVPCS